jgi:hypothetical protein
MSKPFEAAIGALLLRISTVSLMGEWRKGAIEEMKSCSDSIRVLEAAGKVHRDMAKSFLDSIDDPDGGVEVPHSLYQLVAALPDEDSK